MTIVTEPLHSLLEKVTGKPKNTVDFWSLDVEGSEAGILQNTDFSKVEVGVMLIEMNKTPENNATIKKIMREKGFRDVGTIKYNEGRGVEALDHVFVNDEYFRRRNVKGGKRWGDRCWRVSWVHPEQGRSLGTVRATERLLFNFPQTTARAGSPFRGPPRAARRR